MIATDRKAQRGERLMPGGIPRYVRCYDSGGEMADRYTVVFTGRYRHNTGGAYLYLGMSAHPFHPLGFGCHGESENGPIDRPTSRHLGKRIPFSALPKDCQTLVLSDYCEIWEI